VFTLRTVRDVRQHATSWKVAGSSPDEVIEFFFNLPNLSGRIILAFTQYEVKRGRRVWLTVDIVRSSISHSPIGLYALLTVREG
jgi:hypothetical protein